MQSRRDQLQAHLFVVGRLSSALLRAEPDAPQTPLRRFTVGTLTGLIVAIIVAVGFAIYGFIVPGGKNTWKNAGTLIVEKETGTRYVFVDGELRPVVNFTSAKLILGTSMRVMSVSRNSLANVPHGLPVGIESAPDFLPNGKKLNALNWQVCATLKPNRSGAEQPFTTLHVRDNGSGAPLPEGTALVVVGRDGTAYLIWENRRMRIRNAATLDALGYGAARRWRVGAAWLNALPAGPDLRAPEIPGLGNPGPTIDGKATRVGQLFEVTGAVTGDQFYVLRADGLSALTPTGAALVLGEPNTAKAYPDGRVVTREISASGLANTPRSAVASTNVALPATPPPAARFTGTQVPCLDLRVGAGIEVRVTMDSPPVTGSAPNTSGGSSASALADQIAVSPGSGLLISAQPAPGVANGTLYLLVDTGVRYPLPGDARQLLGYDGTPAVEVPTPLLGLVPAGRPLDPAQARTTLPVSPQVTPGPGTELAAAVRTTSSADATTSPGPTATTPPGSTAVPGGPTTTNTP